MSAVTDLLGDINIETLPAFRYTDVGGWRKFLSENLCARGTLQAAFVGGLHAATPGMAFLFGYQAAVRQLDANCPADKLAALVVSEKGVKSPKDFKTHLQREPAGYLVSGEKSHAMLVPEHLDIMYLVAKEDDNLVGVRLDDIAERMHEPESGLSVKAPVQSPFVRDIPHASIILNKVAVDELMVADGHKSWNKPFRYWEDMHVAAAMLGWMYRWSGKKAELNDQFQQLQYAFTQSPEYYQLASFDLLDTVLNSLDKAAEQLSSENDSLWQQDRLLMLMGANIRKAVSDRVRDAR